MLWNKLCWGLIDVSWCWRLTANWFGTFANKQQGTSGKQRSLFCPHVRGTNMWKLKELQHSREASQVEKTSCSYVTWDLMTILIHNVNKISKQSLPPSNKIILSVVLLFYRTMHWIYKKKKKVFLDWLMDLIYFSKRDISLHSQTKGQTKGQRESRLYI